MTVQRFTQLAALLSERRRALMQQESGLQAQLRGVRQELSAIEKALPIEEPTTNAQPNSKPGTRTFRNP